LVVFLAAANVSSIFSSRPTLSFGFLVEGDDGSEPGRLVENACRRFFACRALLNVGFTRGPSFLSAELSLTSSEIISEKSGRGKLEPGGGWGESTIEISGRTRPASASIFSQTTFNWNRHISRGNHQSKMRCNNLPVSHL
jgi:hypothetical protein